MIRQILIGIGLAATLCLALPAFSGATTNVLFILDASGSMWGKVDGVAKIETARGALNKLLTDLPQETNLGLLSYGLFSKDSCDDVHYVVNIGTNKQKAITDFINKINPKGKTPIAGALKMAGSHLKYIKEQKHIVLISDGIETCDGDPCQVAGDLTKQGINVKIHVVGFDVAAEERKQLECIARAGGGRYFNADSTAGFKEAVAAVKEEVKVVQVTPKPKEYFRDDFDGEELGEHWEVLNPNPDGFIIEEGKLLVISSTPGNLAKENVENLLLLSKTIPKENWMMTAKLNIDFQTSWEKVVFGLYKDKDNYIMVGVWAPTEHGWLAGLDLETVKAAKGKITRFHRRAYAWPSRGKKNVYAENTKEIPRPFLLRLRKQGRSFFAGVKLEGVEKPVWLELQKLTSLRAEGRLAIGLLQTNKVEGETLVNVDWIKIETMQ